MDATANDMTAVFEAGKQAVEAKTRLAEWRDIPFVVEQGKIRPATDLLDVLDKRAGAPNRRSGVYRLAELDGFCAFVNRYKQDSSVIFADGPSFQLEAVLNADPAGAADKDAGWRDHRVVYTAPRSPEWIFWAGIDGKPQRQEAFADMIDSRLEDLTSAKSYPEPLAVLEMARNLMVRTGGQFQRTINPTTGEGTLIQKTEHGAESTQIPRAFKLALRVFEGGEPYAVEARIRFALAEGVPTFRVDLHRRVEIERDAFLDVRKAAESKTDCPLFAGRPA